LRARRIHPPEEEPVKLTVHALSRIFSGVFATRALGLFHEDLMTARRRDPAATSSLEIALTYPGVHALWTHRVSHALWQVGAHTPARAFSFIGTKEEVQAKMREVQERVHFDELIVNSYIYEEKAQHYSYQLLKEALEEL